MARFVSAFVFIAIVHGMVAAQEGAFRFPTSDPFSEPAAASDDAAAATSEAGENADADSYQSWPSVDGRSAVQKKAMFRAEQRELRIASRQWYGFSQSRPTVVAVPYMTNYHPLWVGRHWHPYHSWYGTIWR